MNDIRLSQIPSFSMKEPPSDRAWVLDPLRHGWRVGPHGCGLSKTQALSEGGGNEGKMRGSVSIRLAVLGSTNGTHLLKLIDAIQNQLLAATINIVVSNKADAKILERAEKNNIPALFIDSKHKTREEYDQMISTHLRPFDIDLIVLIGYMRLLSQAFITDWRGQIINVHPSLLPAFAGKMDREVHQSVLDAGVKESGCTVHWVTEKVDAGPIVIQKKCPVLLNDSVDDLRTRIQQLEGTALIEAIQKIQG